MGSERTLELLGSFIQDCHYRNLSEKAIEVYKWFLADIQNRLGNLLEVDRNRIR